ncbi:unnamed protein product [Parascedosporium putredinis]|uniref:Enoyl reductase (ER) domain-containing protein n=1 Tax=Parascedosporium putredinis TaxID=1442378 RepID=A0A9P1GTK2_9PEZI|nr:unnamed protein product [Parascedosporium putredinis]CAI7987382.1 unnamed protein product [Parascedosporium putredinis]
MATNQSLGTLPEKMRVYAHTTTGKPSDVLTLTELPLPPLPQPGSSDVLVRITHTTALFGDAFMMTITPSFLRDKPCIPAIEFAGTVVAVDPQGVATPPSPALTVGAEVYGAVPMGRVFKKMPGAAAPSGALAEYVLVPASRVVRRPENVSREHAAGLGGASSCTALALVQKAKLERGQKALVYGSNGSVGTLALQIAREAVGPTGKVVAVCGPAGIEVAKTLGADEVINRQEHGAIWELLADRFKEDPFDAILDAYGLAEIFTWCAPYLKQDGTYVTVGTAFTSWTLWGAITHPRNFVSVMNDDGPEAMEEIRRLAEEGKLRLHVDSVVDLQDVPKGGVPDLLRDKAARAFFGSA